MVNDFILGIGDRLYGISAGDADSSGAGREAGRGARVSVECLPADSRDGEARNTARILSLAGGVRLAGFADEAIIKALLDDAYFWRNLDSGSVTLLERVSRKIRDELSRLDTGSEALAGAYALEFVVLASRIAARDTRRTGQKKAWSPPDGVWSVDDAARHIEANYADAFSLDYFVSKCALNVTDFSRRFKERAGCPLFEFINRQRVARACALLKSSDMSIIDVASAVGYNNLSFFNRYFLRIMGTSPRAFRSGSGSGSAR